LRNTLENKKRRSRLFVVASEKNGCAGGGTTKIRRMLWKKKNRGGGGGGKIGPFKSSFFMPLVKITKKSYYIDVLAPCTRSTSSLF
jgi:hypothetical protein